MTPCDNCIENECEINGYVCPLYKKYQESKDQKMNDDLISRSALKKVITDATYNFEQIPIRVDKVQEIIDNAPTVDAPTYTDIIEANKEGYNTARRLYERPQGEWKETGYETGALGITYKQTQCSNCGWEHALPMWWNFCPNCGAKMEVGGRR